MPSTNQALNRFYDSVSGSTGSASLQNTTQGKVPDSIKALSTKNQMSKTSIELEYSKFESNSNNLAAQAQAQKAGTHQMVSSGHTSNKKSLPNERG